MNDDPKKPAGERQDGSAGEASPVDSASPQHAGHGPSSGAHDADLPGGHGPSRNEDAADLPGDEGLRALYAQLPDVAPRAELDEAILAASREVLRGATGRVAESRRDRSSRRPARERATRVLRWGLPVAAAASVMFAVLREHGDLVPRAEFAASPSVSEEQASRPNQEYAGRIPEPPSAPAEPAERDDSASPQFAPPAPPPAAEMQEKAAPPSAEARSAAREASDSSAAAAMPKSADSSSTSSAIGALAANEASPGFSITEADKPWPFGLEFAMSTDAACAKLRPLSSRGCTLHDDAAVVEFDEPRRLSSGVHQGRWIVAVKMIAKNGVITKLELTERQERKE